MTTLLSDVVSDPGCWSLGSLKPGKFVSTQHLRFRGQAAPTIQLVPSGDLEQVRVPFAPSVFKGQGDEPRKGIVFSVSDQVAQHILLLEEIVREQLRPSCPQIDAIWHSCLRVRSGFPPSFRAKIWLQGLDPCKFFSEQGQRVEQPQDWSGLSCLPLIAVAAYTQKNSAGLLVDVKALMVGSKRSSSFSFLP